MRDHTTVLSALFLAASTLGAAHPAAAATDPGTWEGVEHALSWPADLAHPGGFRRIETARLHCGWETDAVLLNGDVAVFCYAPDGFSSIVESLSDVSDVAVLAGAGAGGLDLVALVDAYGVQVCSWNPASPSCLDYTTVVAPAWNGAQLVRAAPWSAAAAPGLVGLDASGASVLGMDWQAGALAPTFSFSVTGPVHDLVALQWDGQGALEVALATDAAVEVRAQDGALVASLSALAAGERLRALRGSAQDRLVWAGPDVAGDVVRVADASGVEAAVPFCNLSAIDDLCLLDYDGDGLTDVLATSADAREAGLLYGTGGGATTFAVDATRTCEFALGASQPVGRTLCAGADLDADGDADLLFPSDDDAELRILRGDAVLEEADVCTVLANQWLILGAQGGPQTALLTVQLGLPAAASELGDVTHLEASVWHQPNLAADVAPEPLTTQSFALPAGQAYVMSATLEFAVTGHPRASVYQCRFRLVGPGGPGDVARAAMASATSRDPEVVYALRQEQSGPWLPPPNPTGHTFTRRPTVSPFAREDPPQEQQAP